MRRVRAGKECSKKEVALTKPGHRNGVHVHTCGNHTQLCVRSALFKGRRWERGLGKSVQDDKRQPARWKV